MFVDIIRDAERQEGVYFLLSAYVEAVRFVDPLNLFPEALKRLPPSSSDQVKQQCRLLEAELANRKSDDGTGMVLKEALHIFRAASDRLELLELRETTGRQRIPRKGVRGPAQPQA